MINPSTPTSGLGDAYGTLLNEPHKIRDIFESTRAFENKLIEDLAPVEKMLGYEFKNKRLLLEAFTHRSFKEFHSLDNNHYETLEVLGDAILDYMVNSNLIKYTILEKYNIKERLAQTHITSEDFQPYHAHNAKSLLTKNYFLAKLVCLFGLHRFILYHRAL